MIWWIWRMWVFVLYIIFNALLVVLLLLVNTCIRCITHITCITGNTRISCITWFTEKTVIFFLSVTPSFCVSDTPTDIMDSRDASASKNGRLPLNKSKKSATLSHDHWKYQCYKIMNDETKHLCSQHQVLPQKRSSPPHMAPFLSPGLVI